MKLKKKTKIILIIVAVIVVLFLTWLLITWPGLIAPVLWTLLILGIGFFALDFWAKSKKKKKQRQFDEKVSAKEGIEDRKREWQGWVDELEKQGIDRYELPFYLVVGEPQSGKSVLLQNSDLYFPFGQERLSGVGGTRGCDWWFTDEAVILDIAGRLFTHEGGVADKLEWEAFLDQLNEFRPMSPANGVLLVIPCDALLEDSPEVCAEKANKIQSALLTLTQKLEAQLPVYLVLTKGDRIFGFAESVHRMDSEQRHQMFGWSRESDNAERPFVLEEAKAGYARLVDRARLLRERMISTARLPEALPEIDRLYAFPDELEGMYGSLEIYLQRIFTESNLVDRASFRGIYLTSGLQTGAPIAKVCAELLGDDRESDARALEGLFSHQRAYFIKDLVRKRVFAERGLVRPTEGRVSAARRKAVMGYGAAGVLALASIVGAIWHIASGPNVNAASKLQVAIGAAEKSTETTDLNTLLSNLGTIDAAIGVERGAVEEMFGKTRKELSALYLKICKEVLVPNLRKQLEDRMLATLGERGSTDHEPDDADTALTWIKSVKLVCGDVEFGSKEGFKLVKEFLPNAEGLVAAQKFTVQDALENRGDGTWLSSIGNRAKVARLAERGKELLDGLMTPSKPWMIRGHAGFMIAWEGAEAAEKVINNRGANYLKKCDLFANTVTVLENPPAKDITYWQFKNEVNELLGLRSDLETFLGNESFSWPEWKAVFDKADLKFAAYEGTTVYSPNLAGMLGLGGDAARLINEASGSATAKNTAGFPIENANDPQRWIEGEMFKECKAPPHADWSLKSINVKLTKNGKTRSDEYKHKLVTMAEELPTKISSWADARASFFGSEMPPEAEILDRDLVAAIGSICNELKPYRLRGASEHLSNILLDHLKEVRKNKEWSKEDSSIDWDNVKVLAAVADNLTIKQSARSRASLVAWDYLDPQQASLRTKWESEEFTKQSGDTLRILNDLNDHIELLKENWGSESWPLERVGDNHGSWLDAVDEMLGERLEGHQRNLKNHWSPESKTWATQDLNEVIAAVRQALSLDSIKRKVTKDKEARDEAADAGYSWPPHDSIELDANTNVAKVAPLTRTNAATAYLRKAKTPAPDDVQRHPIWKELDRLLDEIGDADDEALAKITVKMQSLTPKKNPAGKPAEVETPKVHYLRGIYKGLRDRLVQDLRRRYLTKVSGLMTTRNANLMEALYAGANDLGELDGANDQAISMALGTLLDPGQKLDKLREEYQMVGVQPEDPTLHPGAQTDGIANEDWWQFEQFLVDLQQFFQLGKGTRVQNTNMNLRMEPLYKGGSWEGVWDFATTRKSFCFFAAVGDKTTGQKVSNSSSGKGWSAMKEMPISWKFAPRKKAPMLWFAWTTKAVGYSWEQDTDKTKHLRFALKGTLAPLLWCWASSRKDWDEEAGWLVKATPAGIDETADFRMTYWKDGARIKPPKRPDLPKSPF